VAPYEVNKASNQRALVASQAAANGTMVAAAQLADGKRLYEGGFRLFVSRSGIQTTAGALPWGSLILMGIYHIEGEADIEFRSRYPIVSNPFATSVVVHTLVSETYGAGEANLVVPMAVENGMGKLMHNIHGYLNFGAE